ncbi:hypothetical protein ACSQ67_025585 [Phaseolus vulgaris]
MVMNEEKRARFAGLLARGGAADKAGPSHLLPPPLVPSTATTRVTPTPGSPKYAHNSPAPIEAIPRPRLEPPHLHPLWEETRVWCISNMMKKKNLLGDLPSRGEKPTGWPPPILLPPSPQAVRKTNPRGPPPLHLILLSRRRCRLRPSPLPQPPPSSPAPYNTS